MSKRGVKEMRDKAKRNQRKKTCFVVVTVEYWIQRIALFFWRQYGVGCTQIWIFPSVFSAFYRILIKSTNSNSFKMQSKSKFFNFLFFSLESFFPTSSIWGLSQLYYFRHGDAHWARFSSCLSHRLWLCFVSVLFLHFSFNFL